MCAPYVTTARTCGNQLGRADWSTTVPPAEWPKSAHPVEVEQPGERAGLVRAPATASSTGREGRGGRPLAVVVRAGGDEVDARREAVLAREQLADPVVADDDEARPRPARKASQR